MASNESYDTINNPKHYAGEVEPIQLILGQGLGYCEGNIVKYICRWKKKGGVEDLQKAHWYIHRLIEETKDKEKQSSLFGNLNNFRYGGTE